jgi:hypothetical protein
MQFVFEYHAHTPHCSWMVRCHPYKTYQHFDSFFISGKFLVDGGYTKGHCAEAGGISPYEVQMIECDLLQTLIYELFVRDDRYNTMSEALLNHIQVFFMSPPFITPIFFETTQCTPFIKFSYVGGGKNECHQVC